MESGRVIYVGQVDFRNDDRLFGIKHEDRFSHLYIIGKTGTGKSTLIETMALQDLECGNGFALIDPHGDLVARFAARNRSCAALLNVIHFTHGEAPLW
jgi:predicted ATPase